jgi:DNA-binding IclR family transcriptional regulator
MNANFNEEDRPDGERVQSVQRALRILRCLADEQPLWGVTELSRRLAISKTVVARLLFTMRDEGFVSQDVASGKYRLGRAVFGLAANYAGESDLLRIGDRVLRQLVDETQLTAQIGVLEGPYQIPLVVVLSPKIMRVSIRPGERRPAHATASGKALLAELSDAEIRALFPSGHLAAITSKTITTVDALLVELHIGKARGYSVNRDESTEGITAIGAPIRDYHGKVSAALSLSSPTQFVPDAQMPRLIQRVVSAAGELTQLLGSTLLSV